MNFLFDYWYVILGFVAFVTVSVFYIWKFYKMPSNEQLNKVREWLLYAVTMAEKQLGSGTGRLKLRFVYDQFVTKFVWLAKVITFEQFSFLVDEALDEMRTMLISNKNIEDYVEGDNLWQQ